MVSFFFVCVFEWKILKNRRRERPNDPIDEMSYPMYTSPTVEQRQVNDQKSPNSFQPNQQVHLQTAYSVCEQKKTIQRPMV